jgi:lysosomal acid lipase/cholesteryl ester hydrolase
MRSGRFIMYDDDDLEVSVPQRVGSHISSGPTSYCPARFPTKNISSPIVMLYGDSDSLVDINLILKELPANSTAIPLEVSVPITPSCSQQVNLPQGYEHLDVLWGKDVHMDVIPKVIEILVSHCDNPDTISSHVQRSVRKQEEEITTNISSSD